MPAQGNHHPGNGAECATRQVSIHKPLIEVDFKDVEAASKAIAI
jgi:hypothetical protein